MAYIEIDNEQVWHDEVTVRHLIRKIDGSTELRADENLAEGEICEREFQATKKEHCTEVHDGNCVFTVEVDAAWDMANRPEPLPLERYWHTLLDETKMEVIRAERNRLLAECDWTQLPDVSLATELKTVWQEYRQALRDLPETVDFDNPIFPVRP